MTLFTPGLLHAGTNAYARLPLALILALGLGASGCQDKASAPPEARTAPALAPALAPAASVAPSPGVVVIKSLTPGDRACYVELENAQGQASDEMASFELCDQNELVGKRVHLQRKPTPIMAMSCEGNPECTKSETVNLIVAAKTAQ